MATKFTIVVTETVSKSWMEEFYAEIADVCDNHFQEGQWYIEGTTS